MENLLVRRAQGEPIAYLLEEKEFWSLTLRVTRDTLIPRPETELLVERALDRIEFATAVNVLDLGTGSGAIALALARERPAAQITATDISLRALEVARGNARAHGLQNVDFRVGHWLNAVPGQCYSFITCNPPYVVCDDPHLETRHTKYEPQLALISGKDGMEALQQIIPAAPRALVRGGWLLLEHGHQQERAVDHLLYKAGFDSIVHYRDTSGKSRVSAARVSETFPE